MVENFTNLFNRNAGAWLIVVLFVATMVTVVAINL